MQAAAFSSFSPEEVQFSAEDEVVTITPSFALPAAQTSSLSYLTGDYGPFQPNVPVQVPLWLALLLKKRNKCRVQAPEWMQPDKLKDVYEQERNSGANFQELPYHYIEIAHLLLKYTDRDTFGDDKHQIRDCFEMLRKLRFTKINDGLRELDGPLTAQLNNFSATECNNIRPFFQGSLDQFFKLSKMEQPHAEYDAGPSVQSGQLPARNLRR